MNVFLQTKQAMNENYEKLHKLNGFLNILFFKLYDVQLEHRKNKQKLKEEKRKVLSNRSLSKDGKSANLSEIERKFNELNSSYNSTYLSLQGQIKVANYNASIVALIVFIYIQEIEEEASAMTEIGNNSSRSSEKTEICSPETESDASNIKDKPIFYANSFDKFIKSIKTKYDSFLLERA